MDYATKAFKQKQKQQKNPTYIYDFEGDEWSVGRLCHSTIQNETLFQ